jgi:cytochrome c553
MGNDRFNAKVRKSIRKVRKEESFAFLSDDLCVPLRSRFFMKPQFILSLILILGAVTAFAQTRRRTPAAKPSSQASRGSAAKYSYFLHSSDKHKVLACKACHKVPTEWTAHRDFPDVADFPNHDACIRCHRQQFFTRQSVVGTGPAICTVCHVRAAPREAGRFAFGNPNRANQATKAKDERQFTIEFPHDKHQNVIASARPGPGSGQSVSFIRASFFPTPFDDQKKPDYNNCTICHQRNDAVVVAPLSGSPDAAAAQANKYFKTMPHAHDSCFNCHWKNQKPEGVDCAGCHKPAATSVAVLAPKRISAMFSHEGGKGEHVSECTTCHINITRASTLRGLTPDVPIAACVTCHKDNKKTTYPKITTIEEELAQFKKTSSCTYCHQADVGNKKPPASHEAAAQ